MASTQDLWTSTNTEHNHNEPTLRMALRQRFSERVGIDIEEQTKPLSSWFLFTTRTVSRIPFLLVVWLLSLHFLSACRLVHASVVTPVAMPTRYSILGIGCLFVLPTQLSLSKNNKNIIIQSNIVSVVDAFVPRRAFVRPSSVTSTGWKFGNEPTNSGNVNRTVVYGSFPRGVQFKWYSDNDPYLYRDGDGTVRLTKYPVISTDWYLDKEILLFVLHEFLITIKLSDRFCCFLTVLISVIFRFQYVP